MKCTEVQFLNPSDLTLLPNNPRKITKADFQRLVDSIKINGFWKHRPLALEEQEGKLVVLAGNQRTKAARKLKLQLVPCVIYSELNEEERMDIIFRDNINNGEFDDVMINEDPAFTDVDLEFIGLQLPEPELPEAPKKKAKAKAKDPAEDGAYNVAMAKVILKFEHLLDKEFVYFYYLSKLYQDKLQTISRTAQAGFNSSDFEDMYFPLPPIEEQQRIVHRIKSLYLAIDNIQKSLEV